MLAPMDLVDPEPLVKARLDEELEPLREQLASSDARWDRWRLRRGLRRRERRLRQRLAGARW